MRVVFRDGIINWFQKDQTGLSCSPGRCEDFKKLSCVISVINISIECWPGNHSFNDSRIA